MKYQRIHKISNMGDYLVNLVRVEFFKNVKKSEGCWIWTGGLNEEGPYGNFRWLGMVCLAHRLSYMLHFGDIQKRTDGENVCVCHRCDVPLCVRPDHLFLGTASDNMLDMVKKKRGRWNS